MQCLLFEIEDEEEHSTLDLLLKKCVKCNKEKEEEEFSWRGGENYRRTECKECTKELEKERARLRSLHGNPSDGYSCPICKREYDEVKGQGGRKCTPWVIDHDHKTNTFRGWLCHKCNRGLGAFNDDVELLKRAADYLKNNQV